MMAAFQASCCICCRAAQPEDLVPHSKTRGWAASIDALFSMHVYMLPYRFHIRLPWLLASRPSALFCLVF